MTYRRQKKIFVYLLNSDVGLSGNELAKIFDVSSRTIRSDIKFLNELLKDHEIRICSSKQQGYFIPQQQRRLGISLIKEIFKSEENITKIPSTPSERLAFILFKLTFARDFITMEDFADMLFVSKTTVYLDIKNIIKFLKNFSNLELEISPIKGLKLKGDERFKRLLISNVLKREMRNDKLILSNSFHYVFTDENLDLNKEILFLYETIINVLNKYGYILTDADVILLVKDILVSIKRIQRGFFIEENIEEDLDLTIANAIKEEIENYFNILLDDKELEYFQQSFNTKRLLNVASKDCVLKEEGENIVDEFLKEVKYKFNIDFMEDTNFRRNFILHLNPMLERIKANYFEDNPFKSQIKTSYPFAFEISMTIVSIIKRKLNIVISESEVSYIALHVAVALDKIHNKINIAIICGSGLGTAQFVKSKIVSYYSEQVNILGYFPVYKLDNVLNGDCGKADLIISTIPLTTKSNIPIVQVNPLITEDDLIRIKRYIGNPLMTIKEMNTDGIKEKFFKDGLFKYFDEEVDFLNAILKLTEMLRTEGYIDDVEIFYASVVRRENLFSTILEDMIAIPHPMESMSKKTVVAVGIFKNPAVYNGKKVKVIFLFAFNAKENENLKLLYELLKEIIESKSTIENVSKSNSFNDFIVKIGW
ncbi:PRD domain-containing protein [Clostridium sp. D2Q-14]|uniref:BglG family transcription antiterminator n=1 Tax=Anaeromonas gelatinilytica TaxID=2683194 RepID=UPI00193B7CDD|nr:PRD domain-containing protein [Anaeromonas gelatinilytica]MBS4536653.1 PRD domain-containing protein [Anaeromonas gelatinilytica]